MQRERINTPISLGRMVSTPGALRALKQAEQIPAMFLLRHVTGDWGEVDDEDWAANNLDVVGDGRLLSAYTLSTGVKIWIITEWDRSVTTILLPSEY